MALHSLYKINFKTNDNSPTFSTGDYVINYWDDSTSTIKAYKNGSGTPMASGQGLGIAVYRPHRGSLVTNYTALNFPVDEPVYQFCDTTTLVSFEFWSIFPYAQIVEQENHSSCSTNIVCDLNFSGVPSVVNPTTDVSTDGEITVSAISSGSIRYSLTDQLYSAMTNTTGVFTGLTVGTYVVYVRDQYNCSRSISVTLIEDVIYSALYRLEYYDSIGNHSKIEILQKDYSGSVTEVLCGDNPIEITLRGENEGIFTPIISSVAVVNLVSQTNFQFLDLFTQDDREYKVKFYKDDGAGYVEKWVGFITPGLYQEQYVDPTNYYVSAEATDQLSTLKEIPFNDASGNTITGDLKLINIISIILAFTDLQLPIRDCISIYEIDQDNDVTTDSPLDQTYIDAESYINGDDPLSCYDVLSNILLSFGARVFQWEGYWYLIPIDFFTGTINYRTYDIAGNYVTFGSFNPLVDIKNSTETDRAMWSQRSQVLEVRPAVGKSTITYDLKKVNFGVLNGGFENYSFDLEPARTGRDPFRLIEKITAYDGWSLVLNGNTGSLPFKYSSFGNNSPSGASLYSDSNNSTYGSDAFLQSGESQIVFTSSDWIRVSFDFFAEGRGLLPKYLKFKFSFKLEDYYLQGDGSWTTDADYEWVEVVLQESDLNNWKTLEIKTTCPDVVGEVTSSYRWKLMHGAFNVTAWKFTSSANLQALATTTLQTGYITWVILSGAVGQIQRYYRLDASTDSTSDPDRLRPSDYHGTTNKVVWNLIDSREVDTASYGYARHFDNVTVEVLPQGNVAPEEVVVEIINSTRIKEVYETTLYNGDIVSTDLVNAENIYYNYYKYSDGTPTAWWFRYGVDESEQLLALLCKRVIEQHDAPKFKLTGILKTDVFFGFINSFLEESSSKYFIPMSMSIDDRHNFYSVELQEVGELTADGVGGVGEFSSLEFDNSFNI